MNEVMKSRIRFQPLCRWQDGLRRWPIIGKSIEAFKKPVGRVAVGIALLQLCGSLSFVSAQGPSGSAAASITEIALERDCSGCPTGSILVLRRNGTATLTATGKARLGTETKASRGTVRVEDFENLARFVVAQNFFALSDQYADPQIQGGPWATTTVTRDGQDKQVFRRGDAGPASLKAIEAAVDALRARIEFVPERR